MIAFIKVKNKNKKYFDRGRGGESQNQWLILD